MSDSLTHVNESWLATLDRVLRGCFVAAENAPDGALAVPLRRLLQLGLTLGVIAGACIGVYALFHGGDAPVLRVVASAIKVPLLFLLTAIVTMPSLYVFSALHRLPVDFRMMLRLLLLSVLVHLAVTASLGPVFAFFCASTDSYPFLLLLNVLFFAIGGLLGFAVLRRALVAVEKEARRILTVWCVVYAIVGLQMGWLLRPFLGRPGVPFAWLRAPEDNALVAILRTIGELFGA
ncbi:MAG: hypothetical protein NXI31_14900 [bacterium]|nr:hypothetical protein [bacterium]